MKRKYFRNLISSILIFSFTLSPFFLSIEKANAQPATSYGVTGSYSSSTSATSGYLKEIAPILGQLPTCTGKLVGGLVKDLFKKAKVSDAYQNYLSQLTEDDTVLSREEFDKQAADAISKNESVQVYDEKTLDAVKEVKKLTEDSNKKLDSIDKVESCTDSIGKVLVKLMLQKFTLSAVNWINNGRDGKPFFLQDPKGYFKDQLKKELVLFNSEISDPILYPFGKNFIKGKVRTYQNKFEENAQYSLDKLIEQTSPGFTAENFKEDFSSGGWGAWTALTQNSANNPLGFYILAGNELQNRLDERKEETNNTLNRGSGFLGDERCADPKDVTRESEFEALKRGDKDANGNIIGKCNKWEYVTPGSAIAEWTTKTIEFQKDSLLQADDLNSAIAAILDAVLNKFTSQIQIEGYAGFSGEGVDGSFVIESDNLLSTENDEQAGDFSKFQLGTEWLNNNSDFNLRTDLTQAIIDEQRTYKEKLEDQNLVLIDLTKTIYQLDYCIPGPHPGFESDSREILSSVEDTIVAKTPGDFEDVDEDEIIGIVKEVGKVAGAVAGAAIGASIGSVVPGLGTAIGAVIGLAIGFIADLFKGDSNEEKLNRYYGGVLTALTGIKSGKYSRFSDKQDITNGFGAILSRYIELIYKYYPPRYLTSVHKDAAREFRKAKGYNIIIAENNDKIVLINGIIKRLGILKDEIDLLNSEYNKIPNPTQSDIDRYEEKMKPFFSEFSRLSQNMVTGDDIAEVDNLSKEARDEIRYVYSDLLTGEYGCEKDLELKRNFIQTPSLVNGSIVNVHPAFESVAGIRAQDKTYFVTNMRRLEYPFTVWYDYNLLKQGETIPVPSGILQYLDPKKPLPSNKMPDFGLTDKEWSGPGFLSNAYFSASHPQVKDCLVSPVPEYVLDCLDIDDLYVDTNNGFIPLGRRIPLWPNLEDSGLREDNIHSEATIEQTFGIY